MPSQLILMYINVEAKVAKFEVSEKVDVGEIQTSFIDCKSVNENNSLWFEMVEQKLHDELKQSWRMERIKRYSQV